MKLLRIALGSLCVMMALPALPQFKQPRASQTAEQSLMISLYGNYDANKRESSWKPASIPADDEDFFDKGVGLAKLELDRTVPVGAGKQRFVVLSTNTNGFGCHACGVLLSAMLFRGNETTPSIREDFLAVDGQLGQPPRIALVRLGRDHYAIELSDEYGNGGKFDGHIDLFAEINDHLRNVLELRSGSRFYPLERCLRAENRSSDDCEDVSFCLVAKANRESGFPELCTSWSGTLAAVSPLTQPGWSDLTLIQTIHAAAPGAFSRKRYEEHFHFTGSHYELAGLPTGGPTTDVSWFDPTAHK